MALNRKDRLVKQAMEDLQNGSSILTHDWLDENKCTADDAQYVAESIAHSIKRCYFNGDS
jgi:hypothetical protein